MFQNFWYAPHIRERLIRKVLDCQAGTYHNSIHYIDNAAASNNFGHVSHGKRSAGFQLIKANEELRVWYSRQYQARLRSLNITSCLLDNQESANSQGFFKNYVLVYTSFLSDQ